MADKIQFGAEFILEMPPDGPLEMRRQMRELKKVIKETIPEQELFASASKKIDSMTELLNHQLAQGIITQDHYTAAVKRLNEAAPQNVKAQREMAEAAKRTAEAQQLAMTRARGAGGAPGGMSADMQAALGQLPVIGRFTSALGPMTAGVVAAGLAIGVMGAQFRMMGSAASYASQNIQTAFQEIDATSDAAEKLGISATSLNILQTQAAMSEVGVESLTNGIQKLELSLADAVEQGGSAAEKFSKLGLSAEQLIRMKPDAAFGAIADAIGKLPSRAQQLNAVFDIFGKANTDIVRMLDSFRSMEKAAIDSGIVISKEQRDAINTADDQFRQLGLTVKGIWSQVAVELVPAFGRLAEAASDFLSDKKTRDEIVATFSRIGTVVDMVAQNFGSIASKVKSLFDFVGNHPLASMLIGTPMIAPIAGAAAVLKPSAEDVNDAAFKRLKAEQSIALERITEEEKVLAQMSNLAVANLTQPTLGFGVFSIWDGLGEKIQKTVEDQQKFTDNLRWQLEITGKTADEIEMMKAEKLGMSAQQLDEIQRLLEQKNIMQDLVDLEKERATEQRNATAEGERLRDSLMTAEEKLQQQAFHWRDLLDRGAISQREFEQLILREGSQIMGNPAVPETIKAGSVEALRAQFGQTKDRQAQMVGILQEIANNTDPDNMAVIEAHIASID